MSKLGKTETILRDSKINEIRPPVANAIEITNLPLQLQAVEVSEEYIGGQRLLRYRGVINFLDHEQPDGMSELFLSTDVEGSLSENAWQQLSCFHERLNATNNAAERDIEIVASKSILRKPRSWVTQTRFGIASTPILNIRLEEIDSARIPGHRWRVFARARNYPINTIIRDEPRNQVTLH